MSFAARSEHHGRLEDDVAAFLREQGFLLASATYHDVAKEVAAILRWRTSPTATYLRHRADRIAVHPTMPVEFEWECKTHTNPRLHDSALMLTSSWNMRRRWTEASCACSATAT